MQDLVNVAITEQAVGMGRCDSPPLTRSCSLGPCPTPNPTPTPSAESPSSSSSNSGTPSNPTANQSAPSTTLPSSISGGLELWAIAVIASVVALLVIGVIVAAIVLRLRLKPRAKPDQNVSLREVPGGEYGNLSLAPKPQYDDTSAVRMPRD